MSALSPTWGALWTPGDSDPVVIGETVDSPGYQGPYTPTYNANAPKPYAAPAPSTPRPGDTFAAPTTTVPLNAYAPTVTKATATVNPGGTTGPAAPSMASAATAPNGNGCCGGSTVLGKWDWLALGVAVVALFFAWKD